ncbi:MAG: ATP-binding cassette domain-containing protein [Clostridiales bacterium]|nr:ATP-binding cassette domain-containing protein [Clostridiales bacterium]
MIQVEHISKTFKVSRRSAGFLEAFKALFHREYECVKALDDISFNIDEGEMVGYIGPNGAGKSSTIKVLSGILTPDSGSCHINGRIPWKERTAHVKDIGVVFGQRSQLWWDVPVVDSFLLLRDIYKIPDKLYQNNLDELVNLLDIEQIIRTPTRQLSLGQRMRCEIAASLLHSPKILFLDEPTIGLDAVSKIAVRDFILELNRNHKTTVILTTHDMQDIEYLTKRIILIGKGKILMDGSLENIRKEYTDTKRLTIDFIGEDIQLVEGMKFILQEKNHGVIDIDSKMLTVSDAISILSSQVKLNDISVTGPSVDEVVAQLYQKYHI